MNDADECKAPDCTKPVYARLYCRPHYVRLLRHGGQDDQAFHDKITAVKPTTCTADDCHEPYYAVGYCNKHYGRLRAHGDINHKQPPRTPRTCVEDGCEDPHYGHGYCRRHYRRHQRRGTLPTRETQ